MKLMTYILSNLNLKVTLWILDKLFKCDVVLFYNAYVTNMLTYIYSTAVWKDRQPESLESQRENCYEKKIIVKTIMNKE